MFEEKMSETIEAGAPSIKYNRGDIRMGQGQGDQRSMQVAAEIWEQMEPQQKMQFGNFEKFYQSGIWRQILQQLQMDQQQEGIASQMPREMMEEQVSMSERVPANTGGRIGYQNAGHVYIPEDRRKEPEQVVEEVGGEIKGGFLDNIGLGLNTKKAGANLIDEIQKKKYGYDWEGEGVNWSSSPERPLMSMEETIKALEAEFDEAVETQWGLEKFNEMGIYDKEDIRRRVELGFDQAKGPTVDTGIMKAANGGRIRAAFGGDMEEKLMMRETIDTPSGIETIKETDTMKMAGGGERGWKAQMLAQQLVDEKYPGKDLDFYDLSRKEQFEIYEIALDMIDSGGE